MTRPKYLYDTDFQKKILENLQTIFSNPEIFKIDFVDVAYKDEAEKIEYYKKLKLPIHITDHPKPIFISTKGMPTEDRQYYRHQKK